MQALHYTETTVKVKSIGFHLPKREHMHTTSSDVIPILKLDTLCRDDHINIIGYKVKSTLGAKVESEWTAKSANSQKNTIMWEEIK